MGSNALINNSLACRLCGQVSPNIESLTTHIESHMLQANFSIRKLNYTNSHIELTRNAILPNFSTPTSMVQGIINTPLQQTLAIPRSPTSHIMYNDLHGDISYPPISPKNYMKISQIDGTKPLIDQLDKPISNVFVNSANINDHTLNLELGLSSCK